ncbi:MAG: single-stranded DNA-binding protein [Clostridia bacterium]|nr:single-stranded DNA-binding protein [Clostridia bacterium]
MIDRDFNKVIITGYPKQKPELKLTTTGTEVINFILVNEGVKSREYIDVTVWGELAEKVYKDIIPQRRIMVEGTLHHIGDAARGRVEIRANRVFSIGDKND